MFLKLLATTLAVVTVSAESAPGYGGYNNIWTETFDGAAGSVINQNNWNIITGIHNNNEWQQYTTSTQNMQLSGGATLQIVPRKDSSGQWTSARVESTYVFTPTAGAVTRAEALIRFGDNPTANKQGLWPAFWLLGNSVRNGVAWPACGELDILETVNGLPTGYGTIHCDATPGGACNEPNGIGANIGIPDNGWHTWRIEWDRRASTWQGETITWSMDGNVFQQVAGSRINNQAVWSTIAESPMYFILNVAVGGDWPGAPNGNTLDGFGSMMEIAYVAHYLSS